MKNETGRKDLKDLSFYLNLSYPVTVHADPDGGYVAEIEELPGCMTQAETLGEAFAAVEDARKLWIETAYDEGQDIPLPRDKEEYGGKLSLRIPKGLHRSLAHAAKREGVSLNQYITSLLSAGVQKDIIEEIRPPVLYSLIGPFGTDGKSYQCYEIESMEKNTLRK